MCRPIPAGTWPFTHSCQWTDVSKHKGKKKYTVCAQLKYTLTFTLRPVIAQCFDAQYVCHCINTINRSYLHNTLNTLNSLLSVAMTPLPLHWASCLMPFPRPSSLSFGKICSPDLSLFQSLHLFHVALVLCDCLFPSGLFIAQCYYFPFVYE